MDFYDDVAPVYVPDQDLGSDDSLFGAESLSDYSMCTLSSEEVSGMFLFSLL
jgi:hypothetical protein